jgi:hypothetical protein
MLMLKHFRWLLPITLGLLLVFGCTAPVNEVSLDQQFSLSPGQAATVKGENLAIKFIEVTGDSRCPTGVECIQAGDAKIQVEITYSGKTYYETFTQLGNSGPTKTDFQNYEIIFNVLPYPEAGKEIKDEDYRLQLTASRKPD